MTTVAPMSGSPLSSVTFPLIANDCAQAAIDDSTNSIVVRETT